MASNPLPPPLCRQSDPASPRFFLKPLDPALEPGLAFGVGIGVKNGIPSGHDCGPRNQALLQCGGIDLAACGAVGSENGLNLGLIFFEDLGIPNDGCDVPLNGAGEGVLPICPEQPDGRVHEVPQMRVPMQRLMRQVTQEVERGAEVVAQHFRDRLGKEVAVLEDGKALGNDGERWQRFRKAAHDLVALMEGGADLCGIGLGIDAGDELPKVDRVAQVLIGTRRQIGMQGNRRCPCACQVLGDGVFPGEPLGALAWALRVLHDPCHEGFREPKYQGAAVLQDLATIRRDALGSGGFRGGADREVEVGHGGGKMAGN